MVNKKVSLIEIARVFSTIGTFGFGGGLAIIALMMEACVEQKKWLTCDEFSYAIGFGQFLGPRTVNAAIFIGYQIRGFIGAIVAASSFIAPSIIVVIILSALYMHFHTMPSLEKELKGIRPVVDALILSAAFTMGKGKINNFESVFLIIATIFLVLVLNVQIFILIPLAVLYGFIKIKLSKGKIK
jgi:chromate transporter